MATAVDTYRERLSHYCSIEVTQLKDQKGSSDPKLLMKREAEKFLAAIERQDYVVLLDEGGRQMSSIGVSELLQSHQNRSTPRLVFAVGGAYGFDESMRQRADFIWSLSQLTLTHDMARVLVMEQIYRGFTILRGEKYHNP